MHDEGSQVSHNHTGADPSPFGSRRESSVDVPRPPVINPGNKINVMKAIRQLPIDNSPPIQVNQSIMSAEVPKSLGNRGLKGKQLRNPAANYDIFMKN